MESVTTVWHVWRIRDSQTNMSTVCRRYVLRSLNISNHHKMRLGMLVILFSERNRSLRKWLKYSTGFLFFFSNPMWFVYQKWTWRLTSFYQPNLSLKKVLFRTRKILFYDQSSLPLIQTYRCSPLEKKVYVFDWGVGGIQVAYVKQRGGMLMRVANEKKRKSFFSFCRIRRLMNEKKDKRKKEGEGCG